MRRRREAVVLLGVTVSREFLPELDEGSIWLHAEMPAASRSPRRWRWTPSCATIDEFPEVATVVTHIGRNDDGTDPWTPSHVEAGVTLRPYNTWPAGGTKQDLIPRMAARLGDAGL